MTLVDRSAAAPSSPERGRGRSTATAVATLLVVAAVVVWRVGPGKIPNVQGFEGIARFWPHYPLLPEQAYVLREALGQALYAWLGWVGTGHYLALHMAALGLSASVLAAWLLRRLGLQRGTIALCLLLVSPVTAVLLEWIGMYDAFSVLVWVLLLVCLRRNPLIQGVVGILGGLQNFEQFMVSIVLLALLPELSHRLGLRPRPVALFVGAVVGKVALELYLRSEGAVDGSRASFLSNGTAQHLVLSTFAELAPVIVFSALGSLWVPVVRALPAQWAGASRALRVRAGLAVAAVLSVGVAGADHTRVMVLVSFPVLVLLCEHLARREDTVSAWLRSPDTWLVLLVPAVVVWSGTVLAPGLDLAVWGL